jgi:hypothetical protein
MISFSSYDEYAIHKSEMRLVSASDVKSARNAREFKHNLDHRDSGRKKTPALEFGSLFHCAFLEPRELVKRYAVFPEGNLPNPGKDFKNAENKRFRDDFLAHCESNGLVHCTAADVATAKAMVAACHEQIPNLGSIVDLERGVVEANVFNACTVDPVSGSFGGFVRVGSPGEMSSLDPHEGYVRMACKPDQFDPGKRIGFDLKSTLDASPGPFARQFIQRGYHVQSAWNLDMLTCEHGFEFDAFLVLAVEKEPPYSCCLYNVPPGVLAYGRFVYQKRLVVIQRAMLSGHFPGFGSSSPYKGAAYGILDLNVPPYLMPEVEW